MIKGILLGICLSMFIVSSILIFSGTTGRLQENLITGAVINPGTVFSYAIVTLFLSVISGLFIIFLILKDFKQEQVK